MRENLSLSERQISNLQEQAEQLRKEKEEVLRKIEEEMDQKLLQLLSIQQKKKLKDAVGEKYEVAPTRAHSPFDSLRMYEKQMRDYEASRAGK